MNRVKLVRAAVGAAMALTASLASAQTFPDVPAATDGTANSQENFNYGVCRGTDPACYHNWGVTRQKKVLLFTRTAGPRHASLGTALTFRTQPRARRRTTAPRPTSSGSSPPKASRSTTPRP
jgi:hypothetical protein